MKIDKYGAAFFIIPQTIDDAQTVRWLNTGTYRETQLQQKRGNYVIKATAGYLVFSLAWIFLSDRMLLPLENIPAIVWMSSVKGYVFVLVTAAYYFLSLRGVPAAHTATGHSGLDCLSETQ